jgi:hypothetical protein
MTPTPFELPPDTSGGTKHDRNPVEEKFRGLLEAAPER